MTAKEILLPVGRIVQGHPMERNAVTDNAGVQKVSGKTGLPMTNIYVAVAIQKGAEQHWSQTEWGQLIYQAGAEGWPTGEFNGPTFAWKVVDGDSAVPDQKGRAPNTKEGFAGHWVIKSSTSFDCPCYHANHWQPHEVIQQANAIKRGDYVRLVLSVQGNAPSQSAGVYVNLKMLELVQAGIEIVGENAPDPMAAFSGVAGVMPPNAMIQQGMPQAAPAGVPQGMPAGLAQQSPHMPQAVPQAVPQGMPQQVPAGVPQGMPAGQPAPQPVPQAAPQPVPQAAPEMLIADGVQYTAAQLAAFGWTPEQIALAPRA